MKKTLLLFLLFFISCNDQKELSTNFNINEIKDGVIYEANIRQYSESGKFQDFTKDIYKLKDLGVKIIWLMPIHPISKTNRKGTLGSYYSISCLILYQNKCLMPILFRLRYIQNHKCLNTLI